MKLLPQSYYRSDDVVALAKDLLGKIIVSEIDGHYVSGIIIETEAYRAPDDKASHAYGNRRTKRTETMYQDGGISYVYLCYGIHHLCNVVTSTEDTAHAVLIRSVEPVEGHDIMIDRRNMKHQVTITNGPGKWTQAFGITTSHDALPYYSPGSKVRIYDGGGSMTSEVVVGPRVGVAYAKECALWPWRFYIAGNRWVSKPIFARYPEISG